MTSKLQGLAAIAALQHRHVLAGCGIEEKMNNIVKVVDGWKFGLSSDTAEAAKAALVSCTDLAERLGYERAAKLDELADRHIEKLNKFGVVPTVGVTLEGRFGQVVQVKLFNRLQALYLIAKSGTPTANDLTVQFIKAFDALLEQYTSKQMTALEIIAASAQALVAHEARLLSAETRLDLLEHKDAGMMTVVEYWASRGTPFDTSADEAPAILAAYERRAKNIAKSTRADVGRVNRQPTFELSVLRDLYQTVTRPR